MARISLRTLLRNLGLGSERISGYRQAVAPAHVARDYAAHGVPVDTPYVPEVFSATSLRVRFTRRAWTSILSETLTKIGTETGGILLGYRDGNDWLVAESIDPGPSSVFQTAYFEYDQPYVTHLANRISRLYERQLDIVGLWHRHPGSFDRFSGTDDGTNASYAQMNPLGALSGLINIDPDPRLSLFHVASPLAYTHVCFDVLDWRESLDAAPLRDPRELTSTIARDNARALFGGETSSAGVIEIARPELSLETLAELWSELISAEAGPTGATLIRNLDDWSDDELAAADEELRADATFLSERGISLSMRANDDGMIELSATRKGERLSLGVLALDRASGRLAVLVRDGGESALSYAPGRIESVLRGHS